MPEPQTNTDSYTVTILNAPDNTAYTLYFDKIAQMASVGSTHGSPFSFSVPKHFKGQGKIKFMARIRTRTSTGVPFAVPIEAKGDDVVVELSPDYWGTTSASESLEQSRFPRHQSKLKVQVQQAKAEMGPTVIEEPTEVVEAPKKKRIKNRLQEQVQEMKAESGESPSDQEPDKKAFWDRFK